MNLYERTISKSAPSSIANGDGSRGKGRTVPQTGDLLWQIVSKRLLGAGKTLDTPGLPTHTTVESVEWYLLTINPFLDYRFKHPRGQDFLMLDWAEDENVVFGDIFQGKRFASLSGDEGPTARNCLSDLQMFLVKQFAEGPGAAKLIGIHAPPVSPWDDWPDDELRNGWRAFDGAKVNVYRAQTRRQDHQGHPLFAIRPAKGLSGRGLRHGREPQLVRARPIRFHQAVGASPVSGWCYRATPTAR